MAITVPPPKLALPKFGRLRPARLRMHSATFWVNLLTLVLVAWLAYLSAHWTWRWLAREEPAPPAAEAPAALSAREAAERVVAAAPFGRAPTASAAPAAVTNLNVTLKGVYAARSPEDSFAILNFAGRGDKPYRVGAKLEGGVVLEAVYADRVVLRNRGELQSLRFPARPRAPGVTRGAAAPSADGLRVRQTAPNQFNFSRSDLTTALQSPAQLNNLGVLVENPGGGMAIKSAPADSLAAKLGLRAGDVVFTVNGQAVNNAADLARLYQDLNQVGQVNLSGSRNGQPLNLAYTLN